MDYNNLNSDNEVFDAITPAMITHHSSGKLYSLWNELNRAYIKAKARFTKSGTNDDDFWNFCAGQTDVYYLHLWLQVKPGLTNYVHGGLLEEDQFDSLAPSVPASRRSTPIPRKRVKTGSSDISELVQLLRASTPEKATSTKVNVIHEIESCNRPIKDAKERLKSIKEELENLKNDEEDGTDVEDLNLELEDAKDDIKFFLKKKKELKEG
jgi:phosphopantetheine adenylyltransferase